MLAQHAIEQLRIGHLDFIIEVKLIVEDLTNPGFQPGVLAAPFVLERANRQDTLLGKQYR
jgi:hypothetical protein